MAMVLLLVKAMLVRLPASSVLELLQVAFELHRMRLLVAPLV